ncbi:Inactive pancreatic lipase-related protein 1 [Frankliniella fusca]|uniref:Inactive pancreatic lipase-related protein 1 n=1 Tax=Frankliniella fusca TaxID=407009 RepID=A0AAE1H6B5_9NEOP|nr:Inactive pancreatic lipase-related protein 1 [Frankliniella fusca]
MEWTLQPVGLVGELKTHSKAAPLRVQICRAGTVALLARRASPRPARVMSVRKKAGISCVCVVQCTHHGTRWASAELEAMDERHDAEIFRAVVTSMAEWHLKKLSNRRKRAADASVCYPEVGCFQDSGPFGYLDMLPSPPEEVDTHFLLYSRRNRGDVPLLDVPFANLSTVWADAARRFNASSPTKDSTSFRVLTGALALASHTQVIVHGFGSSCSHVWVYEMRSALMAVEDCNVICVDWERGATIPNYVRAAANTRMVGKQVALLLAGLQKHAGLPVHRVHVIGFSLGAHVAGFAGAELKNLSRITGLDPAGPLFESQDPRARLDATDANFVDVIHSNGENLILGGLGTRQPLGHVDFYPNGGRMQKGCANLFVGAVSDILWSASENEARSLCNHRRAYKFFTDSVSPRCHFPAAACDSYESFLQGRCFPCDPPSRPCGNMGYYADRALARGALYLVTRDEEPFCGQVVFPSVLTLLTLLTLLTFRKDDEQLQVGGSLSRMVVPHPVMQEPRGVQLLYTAYSGWISSGLARWSIDKVTLSDSFGKRKSNHPAMSELFDTHESCSYSSSVCKKDLVLESGVPVTLPLFAGECNPPRETVPAQMQVSGSGGPSSDTNEVSSPGGAQSPTLHQGFNLTALLTRRNTTRFVPTQVVHVGDEGLNDTSTDPSTAGEDALLDLLEATGPAWQPLLDDLPETTNNGLDGSSATRNRDDARAFDDQQQVVVTTLQPLNGTDPNREDATEPATVQTGPPQPAPAVVAADVVAAVAAPRPEISEPVLVRAAAPAPQEAAVGDRRSFQQADGAPTKPEITEPVLKPTTSTTTTTTTTSSPAPGSANATASAVEDTTDTASAVSEAGVGAGTGRDLRDKTTTPEWTPAVDLNPPPLGGTHIWQHWPPSKPASASAVPAPQHADKESRRAFNNSRAFSLFDADPSQQPPPPPPPSAGNWSERSITVQLLPQRLVALLEQAERYARLAFMPFAAVNSFFTGRDLEGAAAAAVAGVGGKGPGSQQQRKAKHVSGASTAAPGSSAGTSATPSSASSASSASSTAATASTAAPPTGEPTPYLVPLSYSRGDKTPGPGAHTQPHTARYIPLSMPKRP